MYYVILMTKESIEILNIYLKLKYCYSLSSNWFSFELGTDWEDPEDPTVIAENELLGAASSIDAAAKKLANLRPRTSSIKVRIAATTRVFIPLLSCYYPSRSPWLLLVHASGTIILLKAY